MHKTSIQLDDSSELAITSVMKAQKLTKSEAIRYVLVRYDAIMQQLSRAGIKVRDLPVRIELEFPR